MAFYCDIIHLEEDERMHLKKMKSYTSSRFTYIGQLSTRDGDEISVALLALCRLLLR